MAKPVRLFGRLHLQRRGRRQVESIRFRVQVAHPPGAVTRVTDLQLQPGRHITGWTLNARDLGVQSVNGWEWRNAVVAGSQTLVVACDVASASPTVVDVRGAASAARVGSFHFGPVVGAARADGWNHKASQGGGIPPHLTARSDIDVPVTIDGRALVTVWLRGLAAPAHTGVLPPAPPHPAGPATTAHRTWGAALAAHSTWAHLRDTHPDWR